MIKNLLLGLLIPLLLGFTWPQDITVTKPSGGEWYCDLDAVSNGDGSSGSPWNTVQNCENGISGKSKPATLYIKGSEDVNEFNDWGAGGTGSGSELVIEAWGSDTATITGYFRISASHLIFDGKSFTSPQIVFKGDSSAVTAVVRPESGATNVTFWRVELDADNVAEVGFLLHGDYTKVYNSVVHDTDGHHTIYIAGDASANNVGTEVRNNIIYNADRNCVQVNPHETNDTVTDVVIAGNAIYNCGQVVDGSGIDLLTSQSGGTLSGADVYNNLIWNCDSSNDGCIHISQNAGSMSDIVIYNNSCVGNVENDVSGQGDLKNNYYTTKTGTFNVESNNSTSPSYVSSNSASADYLKITAPDPGADTNPPVTDGYFGNVRDASAPDKGAHEFGNTTRDQRGTIKIQGGSAQ